METRGTKASMLANPDYDFCRHTIQDPIHGAITFGSLEKSIIDHQSFQRLHGLRQNSLLHLIFPSANHTRFDHSVGVMWLAGKFLTCVLNQQKHIIRAGRGRTDYQPSYRVDDADIESLFELLEGDPYYKLVVRAAALFHDIGHGPLSHLFDNFFPTNSEMAQFAEEHEFIHLKPLLGRLSTANANANIKHEFLSCAIATRVLRDCANTLELNGIRMDTMVKDVCSVIEERLEPSDNLRVRGYAIHSLLHDIISNDVDADRMDYLLRDSHMSGVNYGLYDPDRILKSMCAYANASNSLRVGVRYSGLGSVEDFMIRRHQMHGQIYGHKTNRACFSMLMAIRKRLVAAQWRWYNPAGTMSDLLSMFGKLDDAAFVSQLVDTKIDGGAGKVKEIAEKLFVERRLVKRVFEERVADSGQDKRDQKAKEHWKRYQDALAPKGWWFGPDEFRITRPNFTDSNYGLRVLRKDSGSGAYRVYALPELSTIVQHLPATEAIYRVFVKEPNVKEAKSLMPPSETQKGAI
jgi:HD superfamily phosphohydrolase